MANPNQIRLVFGQSVLEDSQVVFEAGILDETGESSEGGGETASGESLGLIALRSPRVLRSRADRVLRKPRAVPESRHLGSARAARLVCRVLVGEPE